MSEEGVTTIEVKITATEHESEPGKISIHVEGPDNLVLVLGILELAKAKIVAPKAAERPLVMPVPGIDLHKLRHRG